MSDFPRTWLLLGEKTGDNNQLLALAEALGWPFETRPMRYNLVRAIPPRKLGATLASLKGPSRATLNPPWPDLILAIGRRSVPVARWIRERNDGRTKLVLVGHPRVDPGCFDLVITTRQYPVPDAGNVLLLPLAMSRLADPGPPTAEERAWFAALPRPHLMLALGGPTKYWDLDPDLLAVQARRLVKRAEGAGGTLIAVGSRRTPPMVLERLRETLSGRHRLVEAMPRFAQLMADADELFVTADSIAMLSEGIQTGKPIGMVPISLSPKGRRLLGPDGDLEAPLGRRDLRKVWRQMQDDGLVGTIDAPRAGTPARCSVAMAAAAVKELMGDG